MAWPLVKVLLESMSEGLSCSYWADNMRLSIRALRSRRNLKFGSSLPKQVDTPRLMRLIGNFRGLSAYHYRPGRR